MAAGDGLVTMTPTSIAVAGAGSSASINADGGVDFTAVTSLSLNGVFTSGYDNYLIVYYATISSGNQVARFRLRTSGSDASGSNYTLQQLVSYSTTVEASRFTGDNGYLGPLRPTLVNGSTTHIYGPALAQPTAWRNVAIDALDNAVTWDYAITHSLSTAYDGFTMYPSANNMTGNVHVFGYEE